MAEPKITQKMIDFYRSMPGFSVYEDFAIEEIIKKDIERGTYPKEFATLAADAMKTGNNSGTSNIFGTGFNTLNFDGITIEKRTNYVSLEPQEPAKEPEKELRTPFSPENFMNELGLDINSEEGKKVFARVESQSLFFDIYEVLGIIETPINGKEIKVLLEAHNLEANFDNISNIMEILYGATLRNDEELEATKVEREELLTRIQASSLMTDLFSEVSMWNEQYTDSMGLFGMSAEGLSFIANKLGLDGENHYQWAKSCKKFAENAANLAVFDPAKFEEQFKKIYDESGKYGIEFNKEAFDELIQLQKEEKAIDADGKLTDEYKNAILKAFNFVIDNPNENLQNTILNGLGETVLMLTGLGWFGKTKAGATLAASTMNTFSRAGVAIASKSAKNKFTQGALRLAGNGVKLVGPALNEGTRLALYSGVTGTLANATNSIAKSEGNGSGLERFLATEEMIIGEGMKGSFMFGAFAGVFGSTVTQKVVQAVSKTSSKVTTALADKFAKGAVDANEVFATIMEKSVPTTIAEVAAFAVDVAGFTAFETALALYHGLNCPEEEKPEKFTELLWEEFKGQGYNLGQIKIVSHLITWLSGSRNARLASSKYLKENLPQLKGSTVEGLKDGRFKINLPDGRSVECKNGTEMISALHLMVRGETPLSGKFSKPRTEKEIIKEICDKYKDVNDTELKARLIKAVAESNVEEVSELAIVFAERGNTLTVQNAEGVGIVEKANGEIKAEYSENPSRGTETGSQNSIRERLAKAQSREELVLIRDEIKTMQSGTEKTELQEAYVKRLKEINREYNEKFDIRNEYRPETIEEQTGQSRIEKFNFKSEETCNKLLKEFGFNDAEIASIKEHPARNLILVLMAYSEKDYRNEYVKEIREILKNPNETIPEDELISDKSMERIDEAIEAIEKSFPDADISQIGDKLCEILAGKYETVEQKINILNQSCHTIAKNKLDMSNVSRVIEIICKKEGADLSASDCFTLVAKLQNELNIEKYNITYILKEIQTQKDIDVRLATIERFKPDKYDKLIKKILNSSTDDIEFCNNFYDKILNNEEFKNDLDKIITNDEHINIESIKAKSEIFDLIAEKNIFTNAVELIKNTNKNNKAQNIQTYLELRELFETSGKNEKINCQFYSQATEGVTTDCQIKLIKELLLEHPEIQNGEIISSYNLNKLVKLMTNEAQRAFLKYFILEETNEKKYVTTETERIIENISDEQSCIDMINLYKRTTLEKDSNNVSTLLYKYKDAPEIISLALKNGVPVKDIKQILYIEFKCKKAQDFYASNYETSKDFIELLRNAENELQVDFIKKLSQTNINIRDLDIEYTCKDLMGMVDCPEKIDFYIDIINQGYDIKSLKISELRNLTKKHIENINKQNLLHLCSEKDENGVVKINDAIYYYSKLDSENIAKIESFLTKYGYTDCKKPNFIKNLSTNTDILDKQLELLGKIFDYKGETIKKDEFKQYQITNILENIQNIDDVDVKINAWGKYKKEGLHFALSRICIINKNNERVINLIDVMPRYEGILDRADYITQENAEAIEYIIKNNKIDNVNIFKILVSLTSTSKLKADFMKENLGLIPEENLHETVSVVTDVNKDLILKLYNDENLNFKPEEINEIAIATNQFNIELITKLCTDKELDFPIKDIKFVGYASNNTNIELATELCTDKKLNCPPSLIAQILNTLTRLKTDLNEFSLSEKVQAFSLITSLPKELINICRRYSGIDLEAKCIELGTYLGNKRDVINIPEKQQKLFVQNILANNNSSVENVLKNFDFEQFGKEGLPLKYTREQFTDNIREIIQELSQEERNHILKHFGLEEGEAGFDGLPTNKTYDNPVASIKLNEIAKRVQREIELFTSQNLVITGDLEANSILNGLIQGLPEFTFIVGKKQHQTHAYSVDIHTLKVLQSAMNNPLYENLTNGDKTILKIAALCHDFGKRGGIVDHGHASLSAEFCVAILDKFSLSQSTKDRIIEIVENHHWFEAYNKGNASAEDVAVRCRKPEDFLIYEILAKADLENVSKEFHLGNISNGAKTQAEFDSFIQDKMQAIDDVLTTIYSKANFVFDTQFARNGAMFPRQKVQINGETTELKVLDLNTIENSESLQKYGFGSGVTKDNARFTVHMTQPNTSAMESVYVLTQYVLNQSAWSTSLIKASANRTYSHRKFGFIFNVDQANISEAYYMNTGSGTEKNLDTFKSILLDSHSEARSYVKENLIKELAKNNIELNDSEYAQLAKYLINKKYITQITKDIKIGEKIIKAEVLIKALEESRDKLFDHSDIHSEIVSINPKILGLIAKVENLEECPQEFLIFAKNHNLPIIIMKPTDVNN